MRIALITSGFRPALDGTSLAVYERCRRLASWGHDVLVVAPDYAPIAHLYPEWRQYAGEIFPGVHVVPVPSRAFFGVEWERNPTPRAFGILERHLDAFRPDVVHVDEPERLTYGYWRRPGVMYARRRGISAVAFYHTNYIEYGPDFLPLPAPAVRVLERVVIPAVAAVYNRYAAALVPSATTARKLEQYGVRNVVPGSFNGVDCARFEKAGRDAAFFERQFGLTDMGDRVKLLFVGRLTPDKGWAFATKALPRLAKAVAPARIAVIVAGDGEMRDDVERELRAHLDSVHFLGRVQPELLPAVYANADLHVSCSQKETFGLTTLEAHAAGIPVVAPQAGGFLDTIVSGRNGATYRPDDGDDFVRASAAFIQDTAWRQLCGANGRHDARACDWDVTIANWLDAVVATMPHSPPTRAPRRGARNVRGAQPFVWL